MDKPHYRPRFGYDIRIKQETAKPVSRPCAVPGCAEEGVCNLPVSPHNPARQWLCPYHARAHNESWDFFSGMSEAEILRFQEEAIVGHRPTWPLGKRAAGVQPRSAARNGSYVFEDGNIIFNTGNKRPSPRRPQRILTPLQRQAFEILELDSSVSLNEIKARYKELVKRFHPDANGGDRATEERLKQVIKAYGVLRASGMA